MKKIKRLSIAALFVLCFTLLIACVPSQSYSNLYTATALIGDRETVRFQETNFNVTVADAVKRWAKSDLALIDANCFPLAGNLPAGEITLSALEQVFQTQTAVTVQMTGEVIKDIANQSVAAIVTKKDKYSLTAISGAQFIYLPESTGGNYIYQALLADKTPLQLEKVYTVAMSADMLTRVSYLKIVEDATVLLSKIVFDDIDANGIQILQLRYLNKTDVDAPVIATVVVLSVAAVVLVVMIVVYISGKKKRKLRQLAKQNAPSIDV